MINNSKFAHDHYRERARELYGHVAVIHGDAFGSNVVLEEVDIPQHANVQICEGGAFVEAVVWVPASKFQRPLALYTTGDLLTAETMNAALTDEDLAK